ncbi:MAG TPA: MarR family transcriptional regulator [Burkholderiales bacterium]|jgi:DNA-binding MarR family transcriptional regulator
MAQRAPSLPAHPDPAATRSTSLDALMEKGSERPFRELIYSLMSLSNLMRSNQEHFAAYIGVTVPQYTMMAVLNDAGRASVGEIAARLEVSSQFVTLEVRKLLEKGLVEKQPNQADRRSVLLELTPTGQALMRELAPLRRETNDLMFRTLSAEQIAQLRAIFGTLLRDGRNALHQLEAPHRREQRAPTLETLGKPAKRKAAAKPRGSAR